MQEGPDEVERSFLLRSLSQVGPTKPIGYLPLQTIRLLAKLEPSSVARDAFDRGLESAQFGPAECCIKSGALYVYHREALGSSTSPIARAYSRLFLPELHCHSS